ncbi:MAG: DUF885 domain-containing protein [Lewinellaceae bacterium]|nr:DUF885 domain-containing protein [Lewinellaceae bacterium]
MKHIWTLGLFVTFILLGHFPPVKAQQPGTGSQPNPDSVTLYQLFAARDSFLRDGSYAFPRVTVDSEQQRAAFFRNLQTRQKAIILDKLNPEDRINYQLFAFILADELAAWDYQIYLIPFNAEGGFYNEFSYDVQRPLRNRAAVDRAFARLQSYPQYLRDHLALLKLGMERRIMPPRVIAENYQGLIAPFAAATPADNILWRWIQEMPGTLAPAVRDSFLAAGKDLIFSGIVPAYAELDRFMQQHYLPACRETVGISEIPGGQDYYRNRITHYATLNLTPEEVFAMGEREVARIQSQMEVILHELDFKGSMADFFQFLRTDPQFYATTPRQLLQEASYWAKKIDGRLPAYFDPLPRLSYGVEPVPEAIAPNYTGGRYSPGSALNHRAGNYWVNTYKLESRPLYVLPALTLHEAVPGHHLQMALAEEQQAGPAFRRSYYISAFGEGWGLYAEYLGNEMGIYETPYEQFGRLTYEMWRACRLVVDVGMHYYGWPQQKALDYLSSHAALSLHECQTEIERYIGWPGQAVSYKIGEISILRLRKIAEAALGDEFNIRDFHRVILQNGSVPLFILEQAVLDYIEAAKP